MLRMILVQPQTRLFQPSLLADLPRKGALAMSDTIGGRITVLFLVSTFYSLLWLNCVGRSFGRHQLQPRIAKHRVILLVTVAAIGGY